MRNWIGVLIALGLFLACGNLYDYGLIGVAPAIALGLVGCAVLLVSLPALARRWRLLWLITKLARFF